MDRIYKLIRNLVPSSFRKKIGENIPIGIDYFIKKKVAKRLEKKHPEKATYREKRFNDTFQRGLDKIPIFLISYNRLSYLKRMIEWLEERNLVNIFIIDNASTYPPLLDFYEITDYKVFRMKYNGGQMVFWNDPVFEEYRKDFYIVSDPDLEAVKECPPDVVEKMFEYLHKYSFVNKVGMSLKIDDLPDDGLFGNQIKKWEKKYNRIEVEENVYYSEIDTTFAIYLPDDLFETWKHNAALRLGYPYQLRHLPWYKTKNDIDEEEKFYSEVQKNGWWNTSRGKMTKDKY